MTTSTASSEGSEGVRSSSAPYKPTTDPYDEPTVQIAGESFWRQSVWLDIKRWQQDGTEIVSLSLFNDAGFLDIVLPLEQLEAAMKEAGEAAAEHGWRSRP